MSSLQLFFQVYEREITCSDVVKELSTLIKSASKEALRDAVALYGQTSKVIQYDHVVEKRRRKTKLSARVEEQIKIMCVKAKDEGSFATQLIVGQSADSFYRAECNVAPKIDGCGNMKELNSYPNPGLEVFVKIIAECGRCLKLPHTTKRIGPRTKVWTTTSVASQRHSSSQA